MERMISLNEGLGSGKIDKMLLKSFLRDEDSLGHLGEEVQLMKPMIESSTVARSKSWNSLVTILTSLPPDDPHWFYKTSSECWLFSKNGEGFEPIKRFREEIFNLFREQVIERFKAQREIVVFLTERYTRRQGLFKIWYLGFLDKEIVRIERIQAFSREEFIRTYPQWRENLKDLESILNGYPRLILGGNEGSFIKKCCYSIIVEKVNGSEFPSPLFIEENIDVHLPRVLQLWTKQKERISLELFGRIEFPYLFYESRNSFLTEEERGLLDDFLISSNNLILCLPFGSPEAMKEGLSESRDKKFIGFKAYFLSPQELKEV